MLGVRADAGIKHPYFFLSSFIGASFRLRFFFFPITGATLVFLLLPLLLLLFHQRGHPVMHNLYQSRVLKDLSLPCIFFFLLLWLAFGIGLLKPLIIRCTIFLS